MMKSWSPAVALAVVCMTFAACASPTKATSSNEWPATTVDLVGGKRISFEEGEPLKIIEFNFGPGYRFTDAIKAGAREKARDLGIELDIQDASDPTKQLQQMQDAIQSGRYNGAIVTPIVADLVCGLVTKQMPAKEIMAVVTIPPICGRGQESGTAALSPGQLALVGGQQFLSTLEAWADEIARRNPGPQKVVVVVGPDGNQQSENAITALENARRRHPGFEVVAKVHTDFSTADALRKMQDTLQSHPGTTIVASNYSELTKGSVTALRQAAKLAKVKVYDIGGDSTVISLIEKGEVEMTYPYYPKTLGAVAVQTLYDARMGKLGATRLFANDGHPVEEMRPTGAPVLFIDGKNLSRWKASGLAEY